MTLSAADGDLVVLLAHGNTWCCPTSRPSGRRRPPRSGATLPPGSQTNGARVEHVQTFYRRG
ncbi:hypothetical protein BSZ39_08140 [Bowdeniella nasicola]|uniref:Uncharacterized protein n=2 Tax=Bowdeniella nasicola TaxID=208480 RepID=A0A1Q5Q1T7_9ACTO|nr:hypothetical protein BSZ39_08140 [Bowdeniella nasicola]